MIIRSTINNSIRRIPIPLILKPSLSSKFFSSSSLVYNEFVPTTEEHVKFSQRTTEKPLFSRKTYLIDNYKHLNDTNEILLFVHHNNLNKAENKKIRQDLTKFGGRLTMLKNTLYQTYLKSSHEQDPASKGMTHKNRNNTHPLLPLFVGPTAVISVSECEPYKVQQIVKLLKKMNEKLIIVGAKVEKSFMDKFQIDEFKDLPNKQGLQGQLVGLLTMLGGVGLVRTLETPGHMVYLTMEQRAKDLDPKKEE
ncbi:Ribosomal protein L10 family protein [Candida parapsilosis]|uniref:Ribosomal protein L10 family protein n=1 Tax=Candida parapsilosis TaxID=5480 RepID=A0A8X7NH09_CANPA|nr:Ribosomal protein L10 family protein [Candida parapsilosis]KAF6047747.1 Ribosomal protein L10 family protein [Candida parapsilosis]KAF6050285.1 Ribosomal protein L10 family protein [Candida parapsilosis]KAF6061405.1 Ribosomal protein L10 family protein [Candida parapsilosis]KAI5904192.1 54S ribosomal protein L11 [Candida parapsilosis]